MQQLKLKLSAILRSIEFKGASGAFDCLAGSAILTGWGPRSEPDESLAPPPAQPQ